MRGEPGFLPLSIVNYHNDISLVESIPVTMAGLVKEKALNPCMGW